MRAGPSWPRSARECEQDRHGRGAPGVRAGLPWPRSARRPRVVRVGRRLVGGEWRRPTAGAPCLRLVHWRRNAGGGTGVTAPLREVRGSGGPRQRRTAAARPRQRRPATAAAATAAALSGSTLVDTESNETCHEEALAGSARRSPEIASRRSTACPFSLSTGAAEKTWVMLRPLRLA